MAIRRTAITVCALLSVAGAGEKRAPRVDTSKCPVYTRAMWLEDSAATADLAVRGTPRRRVEKIASRTKEAWIAVEKIEHGKLSPAAKLKLEGPYRVQWDKPGIWLLQRTAKGYMAINPTAAPLEKRDWRTVRALLEKRKAPPAPLKEHLSGHQLYRTYYDEKTKRDVWHGCNVFGGPDSRYVELFVRGKRVSGRELQSHNRLGRVYRTIKDTGIGFSLQYHRGQLWNYSWSKDGKATGISRTYFTEKPGQLKEEIRWKDGLRHGLSRTWHVNGKLKSGTTYEKGFIPPIIRYAGKEKSRARLHRSAFGIKYSAPPDIMDGLKVGMTTKQASELLKLDFSERTGIHFGAYTMDTYLHISFKKGRIAGRRIGHNGVCIKRAP